MRFSDNEVNLRFLSLKQKNFPRKLYFKSYLEKCDLEWKVERVSLDKAGLNDYILDTIVGFAPYISLEFNVFSEYREEAIENYDKLMTLIDFIRPVYRAEKNAGAESYADLTFTMDKLLNQEPNMFFRFKGLPKILKAPHSSIVLGAGGKKTAETLPEVSIDDLPMAITQFNYLINKEMGYLQVPYDGTTEQRKELFSSGKMRLIPIAYKISMAFRVVAQPANFATINYGTNDLTKVKFPGETIFLTETAGPAAAGGFLGAGGGGGAAPAGAPATPAASASSKIGWDEIQANTLTVNGETKLTTFDQLFQAFETKLRTDAFTNSIQIQGQYLKILAGTKGLKAFSNLKSLKEKTTELKALYEKTDFGTATVSTLAEIQASPASNRTLQISSGYLNTAIFEIIKYLGP